jgi:hypothetical protein
MYRPALTPLVLVALAACGGATSAPPAHDATVVQVIRPGEPEPSIADEMTFPVPARPARVAQRSAALGRRIPIAHHVQLAAITEWKNRYPYAAEGLREFVRQNPDAAAALFRGDAADPERIEALTEWAITNPDEKLESFPSNVDNWDFVRPLLKPDKRAGLEAYLEWCRKSPHAALELTHHGHGLAWAGEHLFTSELGSRAALLTPQR